MNPPNQPKTQPGPPPAASASGRKPWVKKSPVEVFLDQIKKIFGFKPPRRPGHAVVDAVQAMIEGRAKVFVGLGGNFIAAVPDKPIAEAAMRGLRLSVAISTKLNRSHLIHGEQALILPCLARSDIAALQIRRAGELDLREFQPRLRLGDLGRQRRDLFGANTGIDMVAVRRRGRERGARLPDCGRELDR